MTRPDKAIGDDRVAIYIRWSTDDQGDGTTLEVQSEGCKHYLLSQGWVVNEGLIFVDDGYSGGNLNRPALTRLRRLIQQGQVDCVVVYKLDRLSRSVIDMVNLVLEEWDGLTYVKSAREPVDTSSAMGKQFFYMLVSFAEWERNVIRERTSSGRLARAREGYKASSRAPYGYRHGTKKGSLEIAEMEGPIVQRMFDLYSKGLGAKAIVTMLNAEGTRNRNGEMWNDRTMLYLLSNPVYTGRMVYGRQSQNPRRGKATGEPFWLKHESAIVVEESPFIPVLIDSNLFAHVQQIKAGRRRKGVSPRTVSSAYLLSGAAKCMCGYGLYGRAERRGAKEYHYYQCLGRKIKGSTFCGARPLPKDVLEHYVELEVLARYGDRLGRHEYRHSFTQGLLRDETELAGATTQVHQRMAKLDAEAKRIRLDYREQRISASDFKLLKQDLEQDLGDVRNQRQQLDARQLELQARRQSLSVWTEAVTQVDQWGALSPLQKKNLLLCFVEGITVWLGPGASSVQLDIQWH